MEKFFEKSKELRSERDHYWKQQEILDEKKCKKRKEKAEANKTIIFNRNPLTHDELTKFGENLDREYESLSKKELDRECKNELSVPYGMYESSNYVYLEDLNLKDYNETDLHIIQFDEDYKYRYKEPKVNYHEMAAENCKNEYLRAVQTILALNINIYEVKKDLRQFKNRGWSSLCGGTTPYIFYCNKNDYNFIIEFIDDCDCEPGILLIRGAEQISTGETITFNCDLYCQNLSKTKLHDFLTLLECKSVQEYIDKRFGHFLQIPELLRKKGYKIEADINLQRIYDKKAISVNDAFMSLDFMIKIVSDQNISKNTCYLILMEEPNYRSKSNGFYELCICQTDSVEKIAMNRISFKYPVKYNSNFDFDNLDKKINNYFYFLNDMYGYLEDGVYYNHKFIERYCQEIWKSQSQNSKMSFHYKFNPDHNCELNILLIIKIGKPIHRINTKLDCDYSFEYYVMRMFYDKEKDNENCFLTIDGHYYYINQSFVGSVNIIAGELTEKPKIFEIAPEYNSKGKFSKLFDEIKNFIEIITQ